ncbi:cryptochrome/photolyase family protein [Cellulomonas soli]|uniref:Deoxyribodipyrimidine photo-lyase n=1 Tax=Cellulomonas soli TaxID=931535 RepID=A0A512PIM1_9CELL|nr:deoxyribodipyrimidine photo-lyase [Cellulomonas soli]NYI59959.1 deoxyribodipyrimidine photo-lyase [Cellulomonas soli]GEP70982.1 deoxyribodipyrimidine photo-lyase [Cellulomonas soli]
MTTVCWFRRDLRLTDHPALLSALEAARAGGLPGERLRAGARTDEVVALYVLDPTLWRTAGSPRLAYLAASLRALDARTGGRLVVRLGDPAVVVPEVVRTVAATSVHVSAATEPFGRRRDAAVDAALRAAGSSARLVATGSPYAVAPGRLTTRGGTPFQVFTPYRTAWLEHGWHSPAPAPGDVPWADLSSEPIRDVAPTVALPPAGEEAALDRWAAFVSDGLADYATERDRPDHDGTSALSAALRWGEVHPRTLLADLAAAERTGHGGPGATTFRSQLAWRDFHADTLWHHPDARTRSLRDVVLDDAWASGPGADAAFDAWARGRTGYPFVDAGMRQLASTGWMHNRVRMVTASFLVKDLHLPWQRGAAHFLDRLVDADIAQNQLNWQWVAGTGRDAAPFFRIFHPVTQGRRFDPDGAYVRRWVPELRDVPGGAVHEPWLLGLQAPANYPERMVDHAVERTVALADAAAARAARATEAT